MHIDSQGHSLSGATAEAIAPFNAAVEAFNIYRGDPLALIDTAIEAAPEFAMAHIFKAYLLGLATEPAAAGEAKVILAHAKGFAKSERELSHVRCLEKLLSNKWTEAAVALDYHTMRFPHDLVGLQAGHLVDFLCAKSRNLRDRIARVLPRWTEDLPGYSYVLGMYAFGLEETGDYVRAEAVGKEAVSRAPLDCWAHHAVAHVLEMQGRSTEGVDWMAQREPYWSGDDNFFKRHNWWHRALFHLDMEDYGSVISLFDQGVRGEKSVVALDLVDASALLWRLHLCGCDLGDRWNEVAACWDHHADGKLYPFNDWHAAMAYLGAGRGAEVERLLGVFRKRAERGGETARWSAGIGAPLIEGFRAFFEGRYADSVEWLHPARVIANSFGGSHAQRDIIDWTLTEAAIRANRRDLAMAFAAERLQLKPHSPVNLGFLRRAKSATEGAVLAA